MLLQLHICSRYFGIDITFDTVLSPAECLRFRQILYASFQMTTSLWVQPRRQLQQLLSGSESDEM